MPIYQCSQGHKSTESDYCSNCGAKILGSIQLESSIPTSKLTTCPGCSAPYEPNNSKFCEICGYNFVTNSRCEVPPSSPPPEVTDEPTKPILAWEIVVTVDPSLREAESPLPPVNQPPMTLRLEKESNLIGRTSEARLIYPEIALDLDDAVSRRHAILNLQADGTLTLRDIDSANGTKLNKVILKPMVDTLLQDGDEFTLGHWTRIAIKAVQKSTVGSVK
ncbi:MAG: FHA domain-containing protein [Nostocaceae cyanobacterium]|nr:FHA domain-containing protein [Nostocaceae cyanobacterium]